MQIAVVIISLIVILSSVNANEEKLTQNYIDQDSAFHYFNQGKVLNCLDNDKKHVIVTNTIFKPIVFMDINMFTNVKKTFSARSCVLVKD